MFGGTVASFAVNKDGGAQILPQSEKELPLSVDVAPGKFGFGVYRAELALHYGAAGKEIDSSSTFVVITWQIVVPILIILLLVLFGIILAVKKYNNWIVKKATAGLKERGEGKEK
jgi:hypothetical protein